MNINETLRPVVFAVPQDENPEERVERLAGALLEVLKLHMRDAARQSEDPDLQVAAMLVAARLDQISPTLTVPNQDN